MPEKNLTKYLIFPKLFPLFFFWEGTFIFLITIYIKKLRINEHIRVAEVMLIDDESGEKLGIIPTSKAIEMAKSKELDLVEVSPKSQPPVCKIMDFGQHLYKQKKIEKKQKQSQKKKTLKGIRLSARIDRHDLETKAKNARKFLEAGNPVKVTLIFRGREMQHSELGFAKIDEFIGLIEDICKPDKPPRKQGNQIFVLLLPQVSK